MVTVGTPVTVYVSTGREPVAVPALANLSVDDAKAKLVEAGLTPGVENRVDSANAPAETILSTSPEAGTSVTVGSTVDLNISSGEVTLIDLTGQTLSAASDFLRASDVQLNPVPNPRHVVSVEAGFADRPAVAARRLGAAALRRAAHLLRGLSDAATPAASGSPAIASQFPSKR